MDDNCLNTDKFSTISSIRLESINLDRWLFKLHGIAYGQGSRLQLEVLYSEHNLIPSPSQLRSAWKIRQNSRAEGPIRCDFAPDSALEVSSRTWIRQQQALKNNDDKSSKPEVHLKSSQMNRLTDKNGKTGDCKRRKSISGPKSGDKMLEIIT